jgi:16S rRNA processing protein RimM
MPDELVLMGRISDAHGLKGEVKIASFASQPEDIVAYGPLTDEAGKRHFEIEALRPLKGGTLIARLKGVPDRNSAEKLRGTGLYLARALLPEPEDDEFYHADLVGLTAHAPAGEAIGEVIAVQNFGAGDLLEIRLPGEGGQTLLVPFTQARVPEVDLKARTLIVLPEPAEEAEEDGDWSGEPPEDAPRPDH